MRTLVIGDIHGGYRALLQVLERANVTAKDKLIFLGDYVDGWSQSVQVIEKLLELEKSNECIFLRGNHDQWCQDWMTTGERKIVWVTQGGKATLDSYMNNMMVGDKRHIAFFYNLKNYYVDDENRGFVHGGYNSEAGLGHEEYEADYYWNRSLVEEAMLAINHPEELPRRLKKHKEVYVGHTSTTYWRQTTPMNSGNLWNLDTGGGWEGLLSIMDIDTKEYWQSDKVVDLYPDEKGRK